MTIQRAINLTTATLFAILSVGLYVGATQTNAQEGGVEVQTTSEQPQAVSEEDTQIEAYRYSAQSGDSYTKMARKAVQTYGVETNTNLSGAQIVYAETNITQEAGSPHLALNEEVSIVRSTVQAWVEKASQLTEEEQAAWQVYAELVDFNTDNVGEVRQ